MKTLTVAYTLAGHDKGRAFAVLSFESEGFALIADGRARKVERPKKKKLKHLKVIGKIELEDGAAITNRLLRNTLRDWIAPCSGSAEGGFKIVEG